MIFQVVGGDTPGVRWKSARVAMSVCYFLDKRCAILLTAPGTFEDVTDFRFLPGWSRRTCARLQRLVDRGIPADSFTREF